MQYLKYKTTRKQLESMFLYNVSLLDKELFDDHQITVHQTKINKTKVFGNYRIVQIENESDLNLLDFRFVDPRDKIKVGDKVSIDSCNIVYPMKAHQNLINESSLNSVNNAMLIAFYQLFIRECIRLKCR